MNGYEPKRLCCCRVPEGLLHLAAGRALWNKRGVSWAVMSGLPAAAHAAFVECASMAFDQWGAVIGRTFRQALDSEVADITINAREIDGEGGVLGESQLPAGDDRPLSMYFDAGEDWVDDHVGPSLPTGPGIGLYEVMLHEAGHAIGLGHSALGSGTCMEPVYVPGRTRLTEQDIRAAQALYGVPPAKAPPPPDAAPTLLIQVYPDGKVLIPGYKVEKL